MALAGSPTCQDQFDSGWKNHGEHVTSDYATPGEPGGALPKRERDHPPGPIGTHTEPTRRRAPGNQPGVLPRSPELLRPSHTRPPHM
jgi:hypothetical protein